MMEREIAWRVFAEEYNSSTFELRSGNEPRAPMYVVTPLGAKINRLLIVGIITDIENLGAPEKPLWRARLFDSMGTYYLWAGQYQLQPSAMLPKLSLPTIVAVIGKPRCYRPNENTLLLSVRPELIRTVDTRIRDFWILECCRSLKLRIEAMREALAMTTPSVDEITAIGFPQFIAEGVVLAAQHYRNVDLQKYISILLEALHGLVETDEKKVKTPMVETKPELSPEEDLEPEEKEVMDVIVQCDRDGKGALWNDIVKTASKKGIEEQELVTLLSHLLAKGAAYEPEPGRIKTV